MTARPYVYCGDWVACCTRPGCAGVEFLHTLRYPNRPPGLSNPRDVRRPVFHCTYCEQRDVIDWPDPFFMARVDMVLRLRPFPHNRNWYPQDHPTALAFRIPHGQSVEDLEQENREHDVPAA